jgi:hypothetical protein
MRIQKTCGTKPKARRCEAYPSGNLSEMDAAVVRSLKGEGKGKLPATYGTVRWNGVKL